MAKHPLDCPAPRHILDQLRTLDAAARAHLADCWDAHEQDPRMSNIRHPTLIAARYTAYQRAQRDLERAIREWVNRHAEEFQRQKVG